MRTLLVFMLLLTLPAHSEIYKWTDADGKVHFGDAPTEGVQAEATGIQPAPLPGSSSPSGGSVYIPSPGYSTSYSKPEKSNKEKSRERLAKRKEELARLRKSCNDAKAAVADARYWRSQFYTAKYKHEYDRKIKAAKRREDNACKLSNFR